MKKVIGIMGPRNAKGSELTNSYEIGKYCADKGYVTLTGGSNAGVMNEALKGAKENGGLTMGILPTDDRSQFSEFIDIPIITTMKTGRNYLNVLSSDVLIACGMGVGTSSEISMAIKDNKKVILVGMFDEAIAFYKKLAGDKIVIAKDYNEAIKALEEMITRS